MALALALGTAAAVDARSPGQEAAHWPCWRGPAHNGSSPERNLPSNWTKTQGIAWVAPLPGADASTPAVWGERIFLSSTDPSGALLAIVLDRKTGRVVKQVRAGTAEKLFDPRNTSASSSPVTDGRRGYFLFGTGDLVALDLSGNLVWSRSLGKEFGSFYIKYGYGGSPLLYRGRLYIAVIQNDAHPHGGPSTGPPRESFLLALDPDTGKTLWRQLRPTDARKESKEAYTTPIPLEVAGRSEVVLMGGDCLTGHDASTGQELWRWVGYNMNRNAMERVVVSAVAGPGLVYAAAARGRGIFAVRTGLSGRLGQEHVAWKATGSMPDVCTPALYEGRLYVLDGDRRAVTCLDASTGEKKWEGRLEGESTLWCSPTAADGKLYCIDEEGNVFVLACGDEFRVISRIAMGEGPCRASIAVAGGQLFIRTSRNLYCVGK